MTALQWDRQFANPKLAMPPFADKIEFRGLRFTYPGAERPALDGINLTIRRGERVAFELELAPKTRDRLARKISRFLDVMRDGAGPFQRTLFVAYEVATARTLEAMTRPYSASLSNRGS